MTGATFEAKRNFDCGIEYEDDVSSYNGLMKLALRKQGEAHRALELLEDYHSKLIKPQDKQLRNAIERVIRIFKSRLFQALLDIQEFYEITLLDDSKSIQQKTAETLQIASKWESSPPIAAPKPSPNNEVMKKDNNASKQEHIVSFLFLLQLIISCDAI
uniref:L27 domain-containing protein n=1 Tax=Strigamia maritima TaxID=126957 RepID=T1J4T2_STRMM